MTESADGTFAARKRNEEARKFARPLWSRLLTLNSLETYGSFGGSVQTFNKEAVCVRCTESLCYMQMVYSIRKGDYFNRVISGKS